MNFLFATSAGSLLGAFNWYGFLIGSAMLVCIVAAYFMLRYRGYNPDIVFNVAIICLPCALVGLRVYYIIFDIAGSSATFADWFTSNKGNFTLMRVIGFDDSSGSWKFEGLMGLAIYGGLIAAAIGAILVRKINKRDKNIRNRMTYVQMLDAFFILIILGQCVGRWGNFANQEAYGNYIGQSSFFPWGVYIENPKNPGEVAGWYQATFFYESFWNLVGFGIMLYLWLGKRKSFDGFVFAFYCLWYGTIRIIVEGLRSDSLYWGSVRVSQLLSGILILYGALAIGYHIYRAKKTGKKIFIFVDKAKLDKSYFGYENTIEYICANYDKKGNPLAEESCETGDTAEFAANPIGKNHEENLREEKTDETQNRGD